MEPCHAARQEAADDAHQLCMLAAMLGDIAAGGTEQEVAGVVMAFAVMRQTAETLLQQVVFGLEDDDAVPIR